MAGFADLLSGQYMQANPGAAAQLGRISPLLGQLQFGAGGGFGGQAPNIGALAFNRFGTSGGVPVPPQTPPLVPGQTPPFGYVPGGGYVPPLPPGLPGRIGSLIPPGASSNMVGYSPSWANILKGGQ